MPPSADRLPECPRCLALPPTAGIPDRVPTMELEELDAFARSAERRCTVRHSVEIAKLRCEYDSDDRERECSYDNHPHKNGYAIDARCGVPLLLGSTCGRKYVSGFRVLERNLDLVRTIQAERELWPYTVMTRDLEDIQGHLRRWNECLRALGAHAPELDRAMRACVGGASRTVFRTRRELDPRTGEQVDKDYSHDLVGLRYFAGSIPFRRSDRLLDEVRALRERVREASEIGPHNAKLISKERNRLRRSIDALREELLTGWSFWGSINLAWAFWKAYEDDKTPRLELDGQTIVVKGPPRMVLGIHGVEER